MAARSFDVKTWPIPLDNLGLSAHWNNFAEWLLMEEGNDSDN